MIFQYLKYLNYHYVMDKEKRIKAVCGRGYGLFKDKDYNGIRLVLTPKPIYEKGEFRRLRENVLPIYTIYDLKDYLDIELHTDLFYTLHIQRDPVDGKNIEVTIARFYILELKHHYMDNTWSHTVKNIDTEKVCFVEDEQLLTKKELINKMIRDRVLRKIFK